MTARMKGFAAVLVVALLAAACSSAGASDEPSDPTIAPADQEHSSASFVGLAVDRAGARADEQGRRWRVIRLDGHDQAITLDFVTDRLNFTVETGVVTDAATDTELSEGGDRSSDGFVRLRVEKAGHRADLQGRTWRIVMLDGEPQAVTADYQPNRLNFTVEGGMVTAAATDAEMATSPPEPGCDAELMPPDGATVLGRHDLDGDGRAEFFLLFDEKEVGITTLLGDDCRPAEVTLDGAPARFPVAFDASTAAGIACRAEYVDDLYVASLTSADGEFYGGRIDAYDLVGDELVSKGGEGSEVDRATAETLGRVDCGGMQHP